MTEKSDRGGEVEQTYDAWSITRFGVWGLLAASVLIMSEWLIPDSRFTGAASVGATIGFYSVLIMLRGLFVWNRDRKNPIPRSEREGWQTHALYDDDEFDRYQRNLARAAAVARAERRKLPRWKRAWLTICTFIDVVRILVLVLLALALLATMFVAAAWLSYWIYDRATTDYGLLAGILIAIPFWTVIWGIAGTIYAQISKT